MNKRHNISIDDNVWKQALAQARREARTLSGIIEILLRRYMAGEIGLGLDGDGDKRQGSGE